MALRQRVGESDPRGGRSLGVAGQRDRWTQPLRIADKPPAGECRPSGSLSNKRVWARRGSGAATERRHARKKNTLRTEHAPNSPSQRPLYASGTEKGCARPLQTRRSAHVQQCAPAAWTTPAPRAEHCRAESERAPRARGAPLKSSEQRRGAGVRVLSKCQTPTQSP